MADYDYFINNLASLYQKYGHRFLVIKNEKVIGAYNSFDDAFSETIKTEKLGTFLIQDCVSNPDDLIRTFQGNISFAV
ncbi:MAG: hypothetical protein LBG82_04535 [Clostridiales Family XIII bacterium]|jgi:hypothetical protein|nr:hypothetical protein [Clostridiales Family XIII bacterium]